MSFAWYYFYGRLLSIPRAELDCMPFGELRDMIACYQIANGAEEKIVVQDDEDMIPANLK